MIMPTVLQGPERAAKYLCHAWRAGLELGGALNQKEIARAARRLMVDGEGKEMWLRATAFNDEIELNIRKGACSHIAIEELANSITSL